MDAKSLVQPVGLEQADRRGADDRAVEHVRPDHLRVGEPAVLVQERLRLGVQKAGAVGVERQQEQAEQHAPEREGRCRGLEQVAPGARRGDWSRPSLHFARPATPCKVSLAARKQDVPGRRAFSVIDGLAATKLLTEVKLNWVAADRSGGDVFSSRCASARSTCWAAASTVAVAGLVDGLAFAGGREAHGRAGPGGACQADRDPVPQHVVAGSQPDVRQGWLLRRRVDQQGVAENSSPDGLISLDASAWQGRGSLTQRPSSNQLPSAARPASVEKASMAAATAREELRRNLKSIRIA